MSAALDRAEVGIRNHLKGCSEIAILERCIESAKEYIDRDVYYVQRQQHIAERVEDEMAAADKRIEAAMVYMVGVQARLAKLEVGEEK